MVTNDKEGEEDGDEGMSWYWYTIIDEKFLFFLMNPLFSSRNYLILRSLLSCLSQLILDLEFGATVGVSSGPFFLELPFNSVLEAARITNILKYDLGLNLDFGNTI